MFPALPCDHTSVAAAPGADAYHAWSRTPSAVVMVRSSTPGGGGGTSGSGKKIRRSSGTQEHPTAASAAAKARRPVRLEIPARFLVAGRLLLAALDPLAGDHVLVAHARSDHRV